MDEAVELEEAISRILSSRNPKKLVVAGPGTGKTSLFKRILKEAHGGSGRFLVLTFINGLQQDLHADLGEWAEVFTLHSFCMSILRRHAELRGGLSAKFRCCPGLASLIKEDWECIRRSEPPKFVEQIRNRIAPNELGFYLERGTYYEAVDFDDSVFRVHERLMQGPPDPLRYDLVLIDEFQDFNRLEADFIRLLGETIPVVVAGDDDQALYSQLRGASWDSIRSLHRSGEFEPFELPYCMRCPRVVVEAVADVLLQASSMGKLRGRIEKAYRYYPPKKAAESARYPKIVLAETSAQSKTSNYMGRYIAQGIGKIGPVEIQEAEEGGYPSALVIASNPYRAQIAEALLEAGFRLEERREPPERLGREEGLAILKENPSSNLGWRILLHADLPDSWETWIAQTAGGARRLVDLIPEDYRGRVQAEADRFVPSPPETKEGDGGEEGDGLPRVKVCTFEGAKGLSAQHVFIAGLSDGVLPRDPEKIQDLEICKLIVGLTRTRNQCTLLHTWRFAGQPKTPSAFLSWIHPSRIRSVKVNKSYWKGKA